MATISPPKKCKNNGAMFSYGKRYDFTFVPDQDSKPGPGSFEIQQMNSIGKNSIDKSTKSNMECTFQNTFDKYKGICYKGMEQSYYLTQSQGPGQYVGHENVDTSKFRSATRFSIPKNDRGLLTLGKQKGPAPNSYKS